MKIVIFTLGFVVLTAGQVNPTDKKLINQINAMKREIKSISSEITSIKDKKLPNLGKNILKIAESNKLVIRIKEELKKNRGKESTQKCQALFNSIFFSIVDQIYVRVSDSLTGDLTKIEKDLKNIDIKLDNLKRQLESRPHNVDKIEKEINESIKFVNNYKKIVPKLVPTALNVVEKNIFPKLEQEKILEPVTNCLKKH